MPELGRGDLQSVQHFATNGAAGRHNLSLDIVSQILHISAAFLQQCNFFHRISFTQNHQAEKVTTHPSFYFFKFTRRHYAAFVASFGWADLFIAGG